MMHDAHAEAAIALGSNLGDSAAILDAAVRQLDESDGITVEAVSPSIETEPVGPIEQGAFLNAACVVSTVRSPRQLLNRLLEIEADHGRIRSDAAKWGPRMLDLDLLLYDDRIVDEPGLIVPHPRMAERRFVLEPLAAIAPDWVHPVFGRSVQSLLSDLTDVRPV